MGTALPCRGSVPGSVNADAGGPNKRPYAGEAKVDKGGERLGRVSKRVCGAVNGSRHVLVEWPVQCATKRKWLTMVKAYNSAQGIWGF